jgi:cytochrome c oxidase subunit 1
MFQSGMDPRLGTAFMLATILIALPSAVKTFNWLGTIWRGNLVLNSAMLKALAFVSMFVIGGLSGIFMAATPVDMYVNNTYFIVAHIHYVLFMSSVFGMFAGIYYWFPKMFGRLMNERLGKLHFAITFVAANCTFFPMHLAGIAGLRRRISDPTLNGFENNLQSLNVFMTYAALVLGAAQLIFVLNILWSLFRGERAGRNPWKANTLEWQATSPPPHGNFPSTPIVYRGPYEYGLLDQEDDYLPQTTKREKELPSAVAADA